MNERMTKKDYLISSVMTVVYLIIALINLGSINYPQTGWTPDASGRSFYVEFERSVNLSRITYLCGLGDDWYNASVLKVDFLNENNIYEELTYLEKPDNSFMKWKHVDVDVHTDRLRFSSRHYENPEKNVFSIKGTFLEIAFYEKGSVEPLKIVKALPLDRSTVGIENLFDEQHLAVYSPDFMNSTYFDEVYFPRTAYEFMKGLPIYENTHPPLGKTLIMIGLRLFGVNPFGWRVTGTIVGALMIPVMYLFGKRMFKSTFLAFSAAFLMTFDFMHFVQTRIGTADGYLVIAIILMFFFMNEFYMKKSYEVGFKASMMPLLLSGIAFGLAVSVKWIGVYAGAGIAYMFFASRVNEFLDYKRGLTEKDNFVSKYIIGIMGMCVIFFIAIPFLIYFLSFIPVFRIIGNEDWIGEFFTQQKNMFLYHSSIVTPHPYGSEWWKWPLMIRPVYYYSAPDVAEGMRGSIASMGNPAIWYMGFAAMIVTAIKTIKNKDKRGVVIFAGYLSVFLPWIISPRKTTFLYHYFGCVPFMILAIVLWFEYLIRDNPKNRKYIYLYLGLVAVLFAMFYPVLTGIIVPEWYIAGLRWLPSWWF